MPRVTFNPAPVLPVRFKVPITRDIAIDAVCGSATKCTIARAIVQQLHDMKIVKASETAPGDYYVKVKPNGITVRVKQVYHHYKVPDKAYTIIRQTDAGKYELIRETSLELQLQDTLVQRPETWQNPERRKQINLARRQRAAEGRPDREYGGNVRIEAAKRNRVKGKKLGAVKRG